MYIQLITTGLIYINICCQCIESLYSNTTATDVFVKTYGQIIFSSLLFRHGDRNIDAIYPNDKYQNESYWPDGFGQLTKIGKLNEYLLGEYFHNHYEELLKNKQYRYDFIKVMSSDVDRTLMSAELFLAGFLPPSESENWSNKLQWQPIPVHTTPKHIDTMIYTGAPCDKYDLELDIWNNKVETQALYLKDKNIFDYVATYSGFKFSSDNIHQAYSDLWDVYDNNFVEEQNNYTLPDWIKNIYPQPLKQVAEFYFAASAITPQMQRLKGGPLLKSIINDMTMKKNNNKSNLTFHIYSGHDLTISTLLSTLGVYNKIAPPYSATVMIELRKRNLDYFVTVLYRNSTEHSPFLLEIPDCKNPCLLEDFISATKNVIPENIEQECEINIIAKLYYFTPTTYLIIGLLTSLSLIIIISMVRSHYVNKKRYDHYRHVEENLIS